MSTKRGLNYNEYLKRATEEQKEMIKKQEGVVVISGEGILEAKRVSDEVRIAIYSEARCMDAATAIPILIEMSEINPNIKLEFFSLEENKERVFKMVGKTRIPTILRIDSKGNILGEYIEFPKIVNKRIENEDRNLVVKEFRSGIYSKVIENEFIDLLNI